MRMLDGLTLLIPEKADPERDAVACAWRQDGGSVLHIGRFWSPPEMDRQRVHLYGNDTFCLVLAQKLRLELVSPPDDLFLTVDPAWLSASCMTPPWSAPRASPSRDSSSRSSQRNAGDSPPTPRCSQPRSWTSRRRREPSCSASRCSHALSMRERVRPRRRGGSQWL